MSKETVVGMRLINGDEILGRFDAGVDAVADKIVLTKVRHIVVQRTPEGLGIVLMPWSFCNIDAKVEINKSHVLANLDPSAETITTYLQQTTGIALA